MTSLHNFQTHNVPPAATNASVHGRMYVCMLYKSVQRASVILSQAEPLVLQILQYDA